jgi:uncharacterized protein YqgC (DUF456 family)
MVEVVTIVAIISVVLGVLGSVLPMLPGAPLSLAGVYLYWWASGYADPGLLVLIGLTALGLLAIVAEYAGGAVSATFGGAARSTVLVATVVGIIALFLSGPLGLVVGVAGTVFCAEFYRHRDPRQGARAAGYAVIGVLASSVVQVLLTVTILVAFLFAIAT